MWTTRLPRGARRRSRQPRAEARTRHLAPTTGGGPSWVQRPMAPAGRPGDPGLMKLECLDHVTLSVAWYRDVLGLERLHHDAWGDRPAVVGAGGTGLALFPLPRGDGPGGG